MSKSFLVFCRNLQNSFKIFALEPSEPQPISLHGAEWHPCCGSVISIVLCLAANLLQILEAKEKSLQENDLFDLEDDAKQANGFTAASDESDSDSLGSDVEIFEDTSDDEGNQDENSDDVELEEFEFKLVAALGTRKGQEDIDADDTDGSDVDMLDDDMDEDEMEQLDMKLAEVFRSRKINAGKKKDRNNIKEAILNLKRRVLDLIEIFLKQETTNILAFEFLLPLIQVTRTTSEKQVSGRCHSIIQAFCSQCSRKPFTDLLVAREELETVRKALVAVHEEAGRDDSKAHATSCSKASLLLMKVLVKTGTDAGVLVDIYAATTKRQLTDGKCKIHPVFFTEWNNWCVSMKGQFLGKADE